jgi:putative transcriptional regulator
MSLDLTHQFLIAMPEMGDPIFAGTVTYILQHDDQGALGLIINRPLNLNMGEVFESAGIESFSASVAELPVYHGGPVSSEQGFILHLPTERTWQGSLSNDQLVMTTSRDLFDAIAEGEGPKQFLFCLGYSGWSAGQLENELKENAWLTVAADNEIIFGENETEKYQQALNHLGIDLSMLSGHGGLA